MYPKIAVITQRRTVYFPTQIDDEALAAIPIILSYGFFKRSGTMSISVTE